MSVACAFLTRSKHKGKRLQNKLISHAATTLCASGCSILNEKERKESKQRQDFLSSRWNGKPSLGIGRHCRPNNQFSCHNKLNPTEPVAVFSNFLQMQSWKVCCHLSASSCSSPQSKKNFRNFFYFAQQAIQIMEKELIGWRQQEGDESQFEGKQKSFRQQKLNRIET